MDTVHFPSEWRQPAELPVPEEPPDYEHTLTMSTASRPDTDTETNCLTVQTDFDDRASRASTSNFATPEGMTPKSSDEDESGQTEEERQESTHVSSNSNDAPGQQHQFLIRSLETGHGQQFLSVPGSSPWAGGSVEHEENSRLDSGSQSTLTESRESGGGTGRSDSKTGAKVNTAAGSTGQSTKMTGVVCNGHTVSGGGKSGSASQQHRHYPPFPSHILSINSIETPSDSVVTFEPRGAEDLSERGSTEPISLPHSDMADSEESFSAGSGHLNDNGTMMMMASGVASRQDITEQQQRRHRGSPVFTSRMRRSPGSSSPGMASGIETVGSATSDEMPLPSASRGNWVARKMDGKNPPSNLKLMREQSSPDVYLTPGTCKSQ